MQKKNSLDFVKLPQLEEIATTMILLARCMWKDETIQELYEADLHRAVDANGKTWWEVDRTVTDLKPDADCEPEVTHMEFDDFEQAVEFYGDAVQITIYTSKES